MSNEYNYKENVLGPHCGNCRFMNWEEDYCQCTNPMFVEDEYIDDEINSIQLDKTLRNTEEIANRSLENFLGDQDYQRYDCICDLWTEDKEKVKETFEKFKNKIAKKLNKKLFDLGVSYNSRKELI